jgi:hypothetical protein
MSDLIRVRDHQGCSEVNHAGRSYVAHRDGCYYVPRDALPHLLHVGGFVVEDAPDLPPKIAAALDALLAELIGADREIVAECAEQIERSINAHG